MATQRERREEEEKWIKIFNEADTRDDTAKDGVTKGMSCHELRDFVTQKVNKDVSDAAIAKIFLDLDKNDDGIVTQEEFVRAMCKQPRRKAFSDAFAQYDVNKDGHLSKEEIRKLLKAMERTDEDIDEMFESVDVNKDGLISKEEFMELV